MELNYTSESISTTQEKISTILSRIVETKTELDRLENLIIINCVDEFSQRIRTKINTTITEFIIKDKYLSEIDISLKLDFTPYLPLVNSFKEKIVNDLTEIHDDYKNRCGYLIKLNDSYLNVSFGDETITFGNDIFNNYSMYVTLNDSLNVLNKM